MLGKGINKELEKVRQALEEHLSSINENTSEIQGVFDYLNGIEVKMDKLSQRLDQLQLNSSECEEQKLNITPLNQIERKIFLTLYTEEIPMSYREICLRSGLPLSVITECVSSLSSKGIPILRSFCNNQLFVKISPSFKDRQAKENLVNLSLQSFM